MRLASLLVGVGVGVGVCVCACGSASKGASGDPDPNVAQPAPLPNTNPDGKPYPSDVGVTPRRGMQPGKAIPNLLFLGYPGGASGLQTVALADFFDPSGKTYKVIHLSAEAVWCADCLEQTDLAVMLDAELAAKGVVFVQALVDGPATGQSATPGDLDNWSAAHKTNFTIMLDPKLKNLGILTDGQEYPWNCDIDARTMEILSSGTGALPDLEKDVLGWVDWVNANPVGP